MQTTPDGVDYAFDLHTPKTVYIDNKSPCKFLCKHASTVTSRITGVETLLTLRQL